MRCLQFTKVSGALQDAAQVVLKLKRSNTCQSSTASVTCANAEAKRLSRHLMASDSRHPRGVSRRSLSAFHDGDQFGNLPVSALGVAFGVGYSFAA